MEAALEDASKTIVNGNGDAKRHRKMNATHKDSGFIGKFVYIVIRDSREH